MEEETNIEHILGEDAVVVSFEGNTFTKVILQEADEREDGTRVIALTVTPF